MAEKLTKDEKKALRQQEWQEKEKTERRNATIKKYSVWAVAAFIVLLAIGGLMWFVSQPSPSSTTAANVAPISARDITDGSKDAPVTLIEYADFQCPACAAFHPLVNQLLNDYKNKIYYVYRMFPLSQIHQNAIVSASAAYAAYKQGAFFKYDDLLFNNQQDWADLPDPTQKFLAYAKSLKLDVNKFKADMNSGDTKKYVSDSENEALSAGINATPTFILNGKQITNPGTYEEFKKIIDNELSKK